jgi:hypothetical protein
MSSNTLTVRWQSLGASGNVKTITIAPQLTAKIPASENLAGVNGFKTYTLTQNPSSATDRIFTATVTTKSSANVASLPGQGTNTQPKFKKAKGGN